MINYFERSASAILGALLSHYDKEVVLVRSNHHLVFFALNSQESQIIRWLEITHKVPRLIRQRAELDAIVRSQLLLILRESVLNKLWQAARILLILVSHDQQAFYAVVLLNTRYPLLNFSLCKQKTQSQYSCFSCQR